MSCSEEVVENKSEKQEFFIETKSGEELSWKIELEKIWRVSSSQDILLSAKANGEVWNVYVKAGDTVQAGQIIAELEDTIGSYELNLQRALNGLERAQINYDSNKISLDKSIYDAELNLEKLERNLVTLREDSEQSLLLAEDAFKNSQYESLDTKSALQLEQLDNNIEKAKLDYEIKLAADEQTLEGNKVSIKKEFNALTILLDDVVEFSDKLLGVTIENKRENDKFEDYLWAKNTTQKNESKLSLLELIAFKESNDYTGVENIFAADFSQEEMLEVIDVIAEGYEYVKVVLNDIEQTLNNSTTSLGSLSESDLAAYVASVNAYQAQFQANYGAFIANSTAIKSFTTTYEDAQASILKAIELQEKDREIQYKNFLSSQLSAGSNYEKTLLWTQDSIANLEDQIKIAQNNLENLKKTRDITLQSLENSKEEARISYLSSQKEYNKLLIKSPINGTISEKFIDVWQEVFNGTQLFNIISDATPEVEVSFSGDEKIFVQEGDTAYVTLWGKTIKGTIYAISEVADSNLNYKSTIIFESGTNILGNIVTVSIPVEIDTMLIPLNAVSTRGEDIGLVKNFSGGVFDDVRIRLWEVYGEYIEVISCAENCEDLHIVLSDISNYDANKFVIVEK